MKNEKYRRDFKKIQDKTNWGYFKTRRVLKLLNSNAISITVFLRYKFYQLDESEYVKFNKRIKEENRLALGRYAPMSTRLELAREKYGIGELSNLSDQPALAPLTEITEPRYKRGVKSVYSSNTVDKDGIADILLSGDIMCRYEQQQKAMEKYGRFDYSDMFPFLEPIVRKSDFAVGNLETTLSESAQYTYELERNDGNLNRNAASTVLDAIKSAGFDMLVTANNHCLDAGITGIYQTINHLNQYGFIHTGVFLDSADRRKNSGKLVELDGIKLGFVSYTYGTNGRAKKLLTKAGKSHLVNMFSKSKAKKDIAALKQRGAEYIIVYIHWGVEFSHGISDKQRDWANSLAEAGADFIAGSHPHVVEPFEFFTAENGRQIPVIYSMGNLVSSMKQPERRDSVLINLKLERAADGSIGINDLSYIPCYTCIEYNGLNYTTLPLTAELCKDNPELLESKERTASVIGSSIKESEYTQ